jgi:hypothetical protein
MGACEWLYGQRSRSNPASDPGSLQRPRVDKFQTPNRQSGPERNPDFVRPWRVQPSIDRTDAVLDRQCIRSRRPRRTRRGRNRPQERRSRWGSSHHPGTRQAPSAYGVAGASRWRQFAAPQEPPELVPWVAGVTLSRVEADGIPAASSSPPCENGPGDICPPPGPRLSFRSPMVTPRERPGTRDR